MLPYLIAGAIGFGIGKLFENGGETFMAGGRITTNEGIIESFLNSNREVRVGNLESVEIDDIMYLRNYRTFIAKRMGDKVKISSQKYSQTTSRITNRLKALAEKMGYSVEYVTEKEIYNFDKFVGGGEVYALVDKFDENRQDYDQLYFKTENYDEIIGYIADLKNEGEYDSDMQLIEVSLNGKMRKFDSSMLSNGGETFMAGGMTNEDIIFEYPKDSNGRIMSWINVGTGNMEIASKTGTVGQVRDGHQLIVLKSETPNKVDYHILVDYLPEENKINIVRGKFNSEPSPKYQSYINDLFRMLKISQTTRDYQDEDIANQVYVKRYLMNNFGNPPKGCQIKATELGVEIHFDSTNKMSSDWAMKIGDKYGYPNGNFEMRYSSGNVPITYVDTSKIAKNTSKSEKGYFNFGETFMAGGRAGKKYYWITMDRNYIDKYIDYASHMYNVFEGEIYTQAPNKVAFDSQSDMFAFTSMIDNHNDDNDFQEGDEGYIHYEELFNGEPRPNIFDKIIGDEYAGGGEITDADLNYYIYPTKKVNIAYLGKIQMGSFFSLKDALKEIENLTMAYPKNEIEKYAIITPDKTFHLGKKEYNIRFDNGGGVEYRIGGEVDKELTIEQTRKIAQETANILGTEFSVTKNSVDVASFDLDLNGEEFEGGSYLIMKNGDVLNVALPNNPVYYNYKERSKNPKMIRTIFEEEYFENFDNGGGVEGITPELNRRVKERAEEIYRNNKGKTKKDFDNAFDNAIREFGYSPQIYHQTMREIGAEYDESDEFDNGGETGVHSFKAGDKVIFNQDPSGRTGDNIYYGTILEINNGVAKIDHQNSNMKNVIRNVHIANLKKYAGGGVAKKRRRSASIQYGRSDTAVDKTRVGKPVGYRFSNAKANQLRKDPYAKPTEAQVKKYLGKGIYKENRKNRSDRDRNAKL